MPKKEKTVCVWTHDDFHEKWDTTCGESFWFADGNPISNGMKFCPFCGRKIHSQFDKKVTGGTLESHRDKET